MIKKSFILLILLACSTSLFSQDVEQELAFLQDIFGECLAESTADDFADLDELYMFVELNCQEGPGDPWGGDTINWEPSVDEELAWLQDYYGECLADVTADDFANVEELYMFVEMNCQEGPDDPWGGDTTNWEPSVEEEFAWLQLEFGECLADYTADDFASIDELYIFVETNCFDPWGGDTTTWEPSLDEEFAWLQSCFEECLADYTADDFASIDELYLFVEENCEDTYGGGDPWGGDTTNWEPSVEEEFAWMQLEFGECLADYTADDFANIDELYIFIETNCFDPWGGDTTNWEPSVEEELVWLQDYYGECLADVTADDFANIDELYNFIWENCEEPEPWEPSVEEEFAWMQLEFGECLADYTADDFASIDELYIFVETNCQDEPTDPWGGDTTNWEPSVEEEFAWLQEIFGDCLDNSTADDFASVDELYMFVETNCQEGPGDPWGGDTTNWEPSVEEELVWMQEIFGDCLANYTADDFASIDELYIFVEENCVGEEEIPEDEEDNNDSAANNTTIGLDKITNNSINMSNAQLVLQELDLSSISLVLVDSRGKILNDLELEETIKVYPNPTTDFINIDIRELGVETVQLYDLKGALVKNVNVSVINGVYQLDVTDLATNMYVLQMTTAKGVVVERIQVIR